MKKTLFIYMLFLLNMVVLCPHQAEAVQSASPQLLYPSPQRIVIFVADG
jgi:hypothetical protein